MKCDFPILLSAIILGGLFVAENHEYSAKGCPTIVDCCCVVVPNPPTPVPPNTPPKIYVYNNNRVIPSLNERSNQPVTQDPLTQSEYQIRIDDGTTGSILIKNRFWINNTSLNMTM